LGLRINTREDYKNVYGENGVYCDNVKIIILDITEIVSVTIYSVPQGQMAQQPTVTGTQLANKNTV
jgi:hypothetical protein